MKKIKKFATEFWGDRDNERFVGWLAENELKNGHMVRLFKDYWGYPRVELVTENPLTEAQLEAFRIAYHVHISGKANRKVKV